MNKKNRPHKPPKSKVVWTYIIISIIFICCYLGVYHTHHYADTALWFVATGSLCLFLLQSMWFESKNPNWDRFLTFLTMLLIGCPTIFGIYNLQKRYCQQQLSEHGVITHARVVDIFTKRSKSSTSYYAKFEYKINNKVWFQKVINNDFRIGLNDSLKLRCSKEEPEIFEVLAIKKYYTFRLRQ